MLYDRDCGLCRWTLGQFLRWDRGQRLEPLALQDPRADELLGPMDEEKKMGSWHLVTPDGRVHSAGAGFPELFRRLPGGSPLGSLSSRLPGLSERAYRLVAENRSLIGKRLPARWKQSADARIAERAAAGARAGARARTNVHSGTP